MKLELKHLAPYLPYGLNGCQYVFESSPKHTTKYILTSLNEKEKEWTFFWERLDESLMSATENIKPILRPLSDLFTKRFDEENGGLRHIDIISSKIFFDNYIDDESTHEAFWSKLINSQIYPTLNQSKQLLDFLYRNHYDVEAIFNYGNGLIDAGLAIDINTLDK